MTTICAITGAYGYLGALLVDYFSAHGWKVYRLTHRSSAQRSLDTVPFELGKPFSPDEFSKRGISTLIHAAYDFSPRNWLTIQAVNVEGTRHLFESAHAGGVAKIITISSVSAYDHCISLYGKAKLAIEEETRRHNGWIVRPALIFGDPPGGMLGSIAARVNTSRVIPVLHHPQPLHMIHQEDLKELVLKLAVAEPPNHERILTAASSHEWTLESIVRHFAAKSGKNVFVIPIPWQILWLILRMAEWLRLQLDLRSDSVLGLVYANPSLKLNTLPLLGHPWKEPKS